MTEPVSSTATALGAATYTTGITILGVTTGVRVDLIVAAMAGAMLRASYEENVTVPRRILNVIIATLIGAMVAPAVTAWATGQSFWPASVSPELAGLPISVCLGYLVPKLAKILDRKVDQKTEEVKKDVQ